jgi:predicted transcriptional regulator YdeE
MKEKRRRMGKRRRNSIRRRRVIPTLWDGTFCRHLQASANFVVVDVSVGVHYSVDM